MNTVKCTNRLCDKEYNVKFDNCPFCGTANPMEEKERRDIIDKERNDTELKPTNGEKFSGWVTGIIWFNILFGGIRGIINSVTVMIYSPLWGAVDLGLQIIGIISLIFLLLAKKWALYIWVGYLIAVSIINGYLNNNDFSTFAIVAAVKLVLMFLFLQIKKDGVSAWSLISRKKTSKKENMEIVDEKDTSKSSQDTSIFDEKQIDYSNPEENNLEQQVLEDTPPTEENSEENLVDTFEDKLKTGNCDDTPEKKKSFSKISRWFFLIIIVVVLAAVWIVVLLAHRDSKPETGENVYVDNSSILHSKRDCKNIAVYRGAKPIKIISKEKLLLEDWDFVCSSCVDDSEFDKLSAISTVNGNINSLYNFLQNEGYDFMGDINEFHEKLKSNDELNSLYDFLHEEGYILPSSDEYLRDFDFNSQHPVKREPQLKKYNLRKLYDTLKKDGYNDIGTYQEFYNWCNTEGNQGIKNRKELYKCLMNDNYDMPEYDTYIRDLFNIKFWGEKAY